MKTLLDAHIKVVRYSDGMEFVYLDGNYAPIEIRGTLLKYAKSKEQPQPQEQS